MLDFQMKHEGEPPARLVAQVRVALKDKGLSPTFADVLVPYMTSADELDAATVAELTALSYYLERNGIPANKALDALKAVTADLMTEAEGAAGDDAAATAASRLNLIQRVQQNIDGPQMIIRNHLPRGGRLMRPEQASDAIADALAARLDPRHKVTMGAPYVGMSYGEMVKLDLEARGFRPRSVNDAIRMAGGMHTTADFPGITENALNKSLARQMEQITPALARAAHEIPAGDYHAGKLLGLSASGMPQEVGEAGEIRHVTIDETGEFKPVPRTYAAMFNVSRKVQINDTAGAWLNGASRQMVAGATERFRHVLLEPVKANGGLGHVMADGRPVFHADHGNLAAAGAALSEASLSAARVALRGQRGRKGEYLAIEPWALVVPRELETPAQKLLAAINATKSSDVNPFAGGLELIVEVALESPTAWYLIGDPGKVDGLAYSFLDGQSVPQVESRDGWDRLGTEYRLVWDLDARFVSWASWYKNPGA
ncbi:MAG: Mu-like prophage major head subunit gpT family protein [Paracoccus sp. (in: a-proteobacteria)]